MDFKNNCFDCVFGEVITYADSMFREHPEVVDCTLDKKIGFLGEEDVALDGSTGEKCEHFDNKLTQKQHAVKLFAMAFIIEEQRSPTLQEIADFFGTTKGSIRDHVLVLHKKKVIVYNGDDHRGMRIVGYRIRLERS